MAAVRRASLFRNGANQAVRIPKEFELPGGEVTIRREGRSLVIEPAAPGLLELLGTLPDLDEDLPPAPDRPAEPVDL
jgi:antitoxin VapB